MKRYRLRFLVIVLLGLALGLTAVPALAQDGVAVTDDAVNAIAKDIYCPVCENTPLDVCPTQACADWRDLIRTQLSEGKSPQEVREYFAQIYGDGVLANPPRRGLSLIVLWILPVVLLLVGVLLFSRYLSNLRAQPAPAPGAVTVMTPPAPTAVAKSDPAARDDYVARVEQELQKG